MHEMGTVVTVIDIVDEVAEENNLNRIAQVNLDIGEVSGILPEFITKCWDFAIRRSKYCTEAKLGINTVKAITICNDCNTTYETVKYAKICPHCGSHNTQLVVGNEYNIKEVIGE